MLVRAITTNAFDPGQRIDQQLNMFNQRQLAQSEPMAAVAAKTLQTTASPAQLLVVLVVTACRPGPGRPVPGRLGRHLLIGLGGVAGQRPLDPLGHQARWPIRALKGRSRPGTALARKLPARASR